MGRGKIKTTATIVEREEGEPSRTSFEIREAVFFCERIFGKPASLSASHEFLILGRDSSFHLGKGFVPALHPLLAAF